MLGFEPSPYIQFEPPQGKIKMYKAAADFPVLAAIVGERYWRLLKEPGIFSIQCKVLLPE